MDEVSDFCAFGAAAGSFASLMRFRVNQDGQVVAAFLGSPVEVIATFAFNWLVALIFSPVVCEIICDNFKLPLKFRVCLAVSGTIGMATPWLFKSVLPIIGAKIEAACKLLNPRSIIARILQLKPDDTGKQNDGRRSTRD